MTIHIDYDSEFCARMVALVRERARSGSKLSLRVSLTTDSEGKCGLLIAGGRPSLRNPRVTIVPFSDRVMTTFFWTPHQPKDPEARPGWSVGECKAYFKTPQVPIEECEATLQRIWLLVDEHFEEPVGF